MRFMMLMIPEGRLARGRTRLPDPAARRGDNEIQ